MISHLVYHNSQTSPPREKFFWKKSQINWSILEYFYELHCQQMENVRRRSQNSTIEVSGFTWSAPILIPLPPPHDSGYEPKQKSTPLTNLKSSPVSSQTGRRGVMKPNSRLRRGGRRARRRRRPRRARGGGRRAPTGRGARTPPRPRPPPTPPTPPPYPRCRKLTLISHWDSGGCCHK